MPRVELTFLGRFSLRVDGIEQIQAISPQCVALLGMLALDQGQRCETLLIADKLFADVENDYDPEADKKRNVKLRKLVSRLRHKLGSAKNIIGSGRKMLWLETDEVKTDLDTFRVAMRSRHWEKALAVYSGSFLPQCDSRWADDARALLHQDFLKAVIQCAEAREALGDFEGMLEALAQWQQEVPENEEPLRRCLTALLRSGQWARAQEEAQKYTQIREEVEPATRLLIKRIDLLLKPHVDSPSVRLSPRPLPKPWTRFIGREQAVATLLGRVLEERVVTITGEGGIGKTRLALEVAQHLLATHEGQVAFADLGSLSPRARRESIQREILRAVGNEGAPPEKLSAILKDVKLVLILDNVEHLWEEIRCLVPELLEESAGVNLLLTSRRALDLTEERRQILQGLPLHEARALFLAATPVEERLEEPQEVLALGLICERLAGWPLALECAAAQRGKFPSLAALEAHLEETWRVARTEHPDTRVPERAHTLEATLAASESLLEPRTCRVWRAASVFMGKWTLEGLTAVSFLLRDEVRLELERLEQAHVVRSEGGHYWMLEPIRTYAATRLAGCHEQEEVRAAHARYFLSMARSSVEVSTLDAERENFEEADAFLEVAWDQQLELRANLWRLWHQRGNLEIGFKRLLESLKRTSPMPSQARCEALLGVAALAYARRDLMMTPHAQAAFECACALHSGRNQARARGFQGLAALLTEDFTGARGHLEEALSLFEAEADMVSIWRVRGNLALVAERQGDFAEAERRQRENLMELEQEPPSELLVTELNNLVHTLLLQGKYEEVSLPLSRALRLSLRLGLRRGLLQAFGSTISLFSTQGNFSEATLALGGQAALATLYGQIAPPEAQAEIVAQEQLIRESLTEATFTDLYARGRVLTTEVLVEQLCSTLMLR